MAIRIRRREFIVTLGGAAAAWPLAPHAQPSGKTHQIGYLGVTSHAEHRRRVDALRTGLKRLGYEEAKNIVIHYRWAEGRYDRLPQLAAELVTLNVDVIVTHTTPGARAAKHATATVPIVVTAVADPVDAGLVSSLHRPGGNLTGFTFFHAELAAKRVEFIKETIPTLIRAAVLVNPANPSHPVALSAMRQAANALRLELRPVEMKTPDEIAPAIATAVNWEAGALILVDDPLSFSNAGQIAGLALKHKLPMIGYKPYAEAGALLEYGVDLVDLSSRSASLVDRILKGTAPSDLPIERAVKFELIVNLKTAKVLGITIPVTLIASADEVIE
jgi:putative ABC transport system substrate-binding protein